MWQVLPYAETLLRSPSARAGLAVTILLSFLLAPPIARRLNWSSFGTGLSLAGLGAALSLTIVNRLGRKDLIWELSEIAQCFSWAPRGWIGPEALLNMLLLVPLGIGLYLGSRSFVLSSSLIIGAAILIESSQAITSLGLCQPSDIVRNVTGGLVGACLGWLIIHSLGDRAPSWLCAASKECR